MASLGHVAVGLAAARLHSGERLDPRSAAVFTALATFADLDAVPAMLGVPLPPPFGHRGALHSLVVATAVGLAAGALVLAPRGGRLRTALLSVAAAASHGILDCLTHGGRGIALLWPFAPTRLLLPWRPVPAAPLGFRFLSPAGMRLLTFEAVLFSPLLLYALWPRRPAARFQAA